MNNTLRPSSGALVPSFVVMLALIFSLPLLGISQPTVIKTASKQSVYKTEVFQWEIVMMYQSAPLVYQFRDELPEGYVLDLANSQFPPGPVNYDPGTRLLTWESANPITGTVTITLQGHVEMSYQFSSMLNRAQTLSQSGTPYASDTSLVYIMTPEASIRGKKFSDDNGNGVQDVGEDDLPGWTIFLDTNNNGFPDPAEPTRVTDANGNFNFDNIPFGTYYVREVIQPGWVQTYPGIVNDNMHVVVLTPNGQIQYVDFGNQPQGRVRAVKWGDADDSGTVNGGDPRLPGWTIYLDDNLNDQLDPGELSGVTDASGEVVFDVPAGTYYVREVLQPDWEQRLPALGYFSVTVNAGEEVVVEFLNFSPSTVSGHKWHDLNGDGVWQASEPGLQGWFIYIDENQNGVYDAGEPNDVTAADGSYSIFPVGVGVWHVREEMQPGWEQSSPANGHGVANVSAFGQNIVVNFGNYMPAVLSGVKFFDRNGNGQRDATDNLLSGWEIYLDLNNDGHWNAGEPSMITTADDGYEFLVAPGTYAIREVLQPGWVQTYPGLSGAHVVTVESGGVRVALDFGNRRTDGSDPFDPKDIVGNVWYDQSGQRRWDLPSEDGLGGVQIALNGFTDGGAPVSRTTTTNAQGVYRFGDLEFGDYRITKVGDADLFLEYPLMPRVSAAGHGHRVVLSEGYIGIAQDEAPILTGGFTGWANQIASAGSGQVYMGLMLSLDMDDDGEADTEAYASGALPLQWAPRAGQPGLQVLYGAMKLYGYSEVLGEFQVGLQGIGSNDGLLGGSMGLSAPLSMNLLLYVDLDGERWNALEADVLRLQGDAFRWIPYGSRLESDAPVRLLDPFGRLKGKVVAAEAQILYAADFGVNRSRFGHAPADLYPSLVEDGGARVIEPRDAEDNPVFAGTSFPARYKVRTIASPEPPALDLNAASPAVTFPVQVRSGGSVTIPMATEGTGWLTVWADLDRDGSWETSELLIDRLALTTPDGRRTFFRFDLPVATNGAVWVRMRLSPNSELPSPHGVGFGGDLRDMPLVINNEGARLRGQLFQDLDSNGLLGPNEPLLVGYQIYIDANGNGQHDMDESLTVTDDEGRYEFNLSAGGTFQLRVMPSQQGQVISSPAAVQVGENEDKLFDIGVTVTIVSDHEEKPSLPHTVELDQNYPNPFNPSTMISYRLPETSTVRLSVHDVTGRELQMLVNAKQNGGSHQVVFDASKLSSGVYLYRLQIGTTVLTKKMVLVK